MSDGEILTLYLFFSKFLKFLLQSEQKICFILQQRLIVNLRAPLVIF